jgi:hypothetical protein
LLLQRTSSGLEEIGVLESWRTERSKFALFDRSNRRAEREFGEFSGVRRLSADFFTAVIFLVHFWIQQKMNI